MKKKEYFAPKMGLIDLKHQACLLSGSGEEVCEDGDYCDELGLNIQGVSNSKG
ncbi:hypothetical protein [uncultured Fibrobacter sp.]|uniref:hypothetical protein n=1 Tax=uncultured Fibrobacter sp. TaxID=261512 RepID=UPI0025DFA5B0|nr:hypothetical protein [uncultured Fibrobacter sp.]